MSLLKWYFFKCTLFQRYWFPYESSINAFSPSNFTILNVLFNKFVNNLFSLCIFFANTTSPFSNSISLAWRFWSLYCLFFAVRCKSLLSLWFFCFLVSIYCGILFLTCLLNNNITGAAIAVWCDEVLYNNKNLLNSPLQSFLSPWAHWLTF